MRVLVTGATGFIGKDLVKGLVKDSHYCRCLARKTSNIEELKKLGNLEMFYGDITDRDSLKGIAEDIDVVYHLAAIGNVTSVSKETYETYTTINLL